MSRAPVVAADRLSKVYGRDGLRALLWPRREWSRAVDPRADSCSMALCDVSLAVGHGQSLGIIGANGAGKTTLLRILCGLTRPSSGRLEVIGSLRGLIDLGAGLIEELSGRSNAMIWLGLDGVTGRARARALEGLEEFVGFSEFLDEPVRTYSAGMRLRLAYALATAASPDVLVADEILAVGDEEFQRRCALHVERFLGHGGTLILASHSLYLVEKLCARAIWLDRGKVVAHGPAREVTGAYRAEVEAREASLVDTGGGGSSREPAVAGPGVRAEAGEGDARLRVRSSATGEARLGEGEALELCVEGRGGPADDLEVQILRPNGVCIARFELGSASTLRLDRNPLLPGRYRVRLLRRSAGSLRRVDEIALECIGSGWETGTIRLAHHWG